MLDTLKPLNDWIWILTLSLWIIYTILSARTPSLGDTLSEAVQNAGLWNVVVPYALAVVLGHWFLPRMEPLLSQQESLYVLLFLSWTVFVAGLALRDWTLSISDPLLGWIIIALGLVTGHLFWPMPPRPIP